MDTAPNQPATTPKGEEWRAMDGGKQLYNPSLSDDVVAASRQGIERYRMGECVLRMVDRSGNPLAGWSFDVEQTRHQFPFGEGLWALDAMYRDKEEQTERARAWRRRFAEVFNCATNLCYWTERPRNDASKTEDQQGEQRLENFASTVDWCLTEGITAKGHPLFWSIDKCIPEWVKRYDVETQMKFAEVRVRSLVARFKGRVKIWDVVNEALWEAAPKHLSQRKWPHLESTEDMAEYIMPVLRWCREEDPEALYLINDYGVENESPRAVQSDHGPVTAASQRRRYIALANHLRERGYAPDALGLQSHTGMMAYHHEQVAVYDEYAAAGWEVHITEFWAHLHTLMNDFPELSESDAQQLLAEYVANYLTVAFGHPAVGAFSFWGFMGMAIRWHERSGHELLPVFHRVNDLINRDWQTRTGCVSDDDGLIHFKGFFGDYRIRHGSRSGHGFQFGKHFQFSGNCRGPVEMVWQHSLV